MDFGKLRHFEVDLAPSLGYTSLLDERNSRIQGYSIEKKNIFQSRHNVGAVERWVLAGCARARGNARPSAG